MTVLETERLLIRHLTLADSEFILQLVNDPGFIEHIGDRGIRSLEQSSNYLINGPIASYAEHGHGLYLVLLRDSATPIGMCGLLRRAQFEEIDLGYALLPEFQSRGFALEAAGAVLDFAHTSLGAARVLGLVSPANQRSVNLLVRLGFEFSESRQLRASGDPTAVYVHSGVPRA